MSQTKRYLTDVDLKKSIALPAANASSNTASIDLRQEPVFPLNEQFEVEISIPALPDLVSAKSATFTLKHSTDDETFTAIPEVEPVVVLADGDGGDAVVRTIHLPGATHRYIRLDAEVELGGGDNTDVDATLALKF